MSIFKMKSNKILRAKDSGLKQNRKQGEDEKSREYKMHTHTHSHTSENSVSEMYTNNVPHATIKANENNGDDDGDDDDDDEKLTYKNI